MNEMQAKIVSDLKNLIINRFHENLRDIILFGSQLTGESNKYSDYDILIIFKHKVDWKIEREISDLCYEIDLKYGIITDTHVLSEEDINTPRGKQPIFINAIANGYRA